MLRKARKYVAIAVCVFLMASTVIAVDLSSGSSSFAASSNPYQDHFKDQYSKIKDTSNGYFSSDGVPYHSIETLMVEAPDYGHETTSEAYSYYAWLEAVNGKFTGSWTGFAKAWETIEKYIIPDKNNQPGMSQYTPSKVASIATEHSTVEGYPSQLNTNTPAGADPINASLKSAYGTDEMYGMHWIQDVDNWYGYGNKADGTSKNSFINTYQRGEQESCWETVPHPSWEEFKWGGTNGFLDLFVKDSSYSKQWRYTIAPDADARAVQATYWASQWGGSSVTTQVSKAAKMGDYLRYCFFDKYFKPIGTASLSGPGGTGYDSCHYLISWYYSWGGGIGASWAWKIGCSGTHKGYQNPLAAYALSTVTALKPKSSSGANDWAKSLKTQLDFYAWLQSSEGGIAGGANNSWNGAYDAIPSSVNKFNGMGYDPDPVWHDPPSNKWFGFQAWSMQRVAEYYYVSGDSKAKAIMDKWVKWVLPNVKFADDLKSFEIPSDQEWTGQPDTWTGTPSENSNLHVSILNYSKDLGVSASLANTLTYYAAATKKSGGETDQSKKALETAQKLLDIMWNQYRDSKGIAIEESRSDYKRFFDQEIYIPSGWTGKNAQGANIKSGMKFKDMRPKYQQDPSWSALQTAYDSGTDFKITYHRFWAQCEIAVAFGVMDILFPGQQPVVPEGGITNPPSNTPTTPPVSGSEKQRCDINNDKYINMTDVMLAAGAFNTRTGDVKYSAKYDINNDGAVNMLDIMIIAKYYNQSV